MAFSASNAAGHVKITPLTFFHCVTAHIIINLSTFVLRDVSCRLTLLNELLKERVDISKDLLDVELHLASCLKRLH